MKTLLFLCLLLTSPLSSQLQTYKYSYSGPPNSIVPYSISATPNSIFRLDLCTINVPDKLIVATPSDTLSFYIGGNIPTTQIATQPDWYLGYAEFVYEEETLTQTVDHAPVSPSDFDCGLTGYALTQPEGMLRLYYTVPPKACKLSFTLEGNKKSDTVYSLNVYLLEEGFLDPTIDTVYIPTCAPRSPKLLSTECYDYWVIYSDWGIYTSPLVTHPSCTGAYDGSIQFYNYPDYNLDSLSIGDYSITISNPVCSKTFELTLSAPAPCNLYVPNTFNPSTSPFLLFSQYDNPYQLTVYSRWGELIYSGQHISNVSGWDGSSYPPGVYTYVISYFDLQLTGDITLVR